MPGAAAGTLAGTVREVATSDLVSSQSLQGAVEVRAPSADGDGVVAETGLDGMFRLDDIEQGETVWVGVGAFDDPPSEPFMDTLQAVDSIRSNVVDLLVFRRDLMRELASVAFLNQPIELDPAAAHIVMRFIGEDRAPLVGVHITFPDPTLISTAYDLGDDTYSDAQDETSTRGVVVLLNLPAARFPGVSTGIAADIDGKPFTTRLQIAAGAVTVVTAIVADP
jgi:hypothetical protein